VYVALSIGLCGDASRLKVLLCDSVRAYFDPNL